MNYLISIYRYLRAHPLFALWLMLPLAMIISRALVYAQGGEVTLGEPASFPPIYLLWYTLGTLIHWAKKYVETQAQLGVGVTFVRWFGKQWVLSITTFLGGIAALYGMFSASPDYYLSGGIMTIVNIVMQGIVFDTVNTSSSAFGGRTAPVPPSGPHSLTDTQ